LIVASLLFLTPILVVVVLLPVLRFVDFLHRCDQYNVPRKLDR